MFSVDYICSICVNVNYDIKKLDVGNICAIFDLLFKFHNKRVIVTDADMEASTELDARIIFGGKYDQWSNEYKNLVKKEIAMTYMG